MVWWWGSGGLLRRWVETGGSFGVEFGGKSWCDCFSMILSKRMVGFKTETLYVGVVVALLVDMEAAKWSLAPSTPRWGVCGSGGCRFALADAKRSFFFPKGFLLVLGQVHLFVVPFQGGVQHQYYTASSISMESYWFILLLWLVPVCLEALRVDKTS